MGSSNVCWGLEIGGGAVKAIKLEAEGDGVRVVDFAIAPHVKVLSTPELDQEDAIRVALGQLTNQVDLTGERVVMSLPGHQSFARFAKLPPVEPKKVPDIVKFEAVQQIPFPLEEVEWDFQTFVSPDSPDVEVGIFAVTKQRINERLTMLADLGIVPEMATISPVAAYNGLAWDLGFTEETAGTIILDVGTTASDLIIADAGRVWVRTFPVGGHAFTEALVNTFKLSYGKAEKLKREAEQTKHARHVFQAMRPVFGDLAQEVQRSIGFYQSVHPDAELKRLIGLGSTFRLPGLRKFLKQQLGLDVYRMEEYKKISLDGPRAAEFQTATLNLTTAYGLALQGLGKSTLEANLMPVRVLREAMWKRKTPWFAAAAGVAAAAAGAMFVRPLIDSTAFNSAERPRIIDTVLRTAGDLKRDAEAAEVTSGAQPDLRAAQIVDVVADRGLYRTLLADAAEALGSAGSGEEMPLRFVGLETTFASSGADDASGGVSDSYSSPRGGSSGGWAPPGRDRGGASFPQPGGAADTGPADQAYTDALAKPHVRMQLTVSASMIRPDMERLLNETIDRWLRQHAAREGYTIVVPQNRPSFRITEGAASVGSGRTTRPRPGSSSRDYDDRSPSGGWQPGGRPGTGAPEPTTDEPGMTATITWLAVLGAPAGEGGDS